MGRSFARSFRWCIMEYHIRGSIFGEILGKVSNTVWRIFSAKELIEHETPPPSWKISFKISILFFETLPLIRLRNICVLAEMGGTPLCGKYFSYKTYGGFGGTFPTPLQKTFAKQYWTHSLTLGVIWEERGRSKGYTALNPFSILGFPQSSWLDYGTLLQSVGFFDKHSSLSIFPDSPPLHNDATGLDHLALITCCPQLMGYDSSPTLFESELCLKS